MTLINVVRAACQRAIKVKHGLLGWVLLLGVVGIVYCSARRTEIRRKFGIAGAACLPLPTGDWQSTLTQQKAPTLLFPLCQFTRSAEVLDAVCMQAAGWATCACGAGARCARCARYVFTCACHACNLPCC